MGGNPLAWTDPKGLNWGGSASDEIPRSGNPSDIHIQLTPDDLLIMGGAGGIIVKGVIKYGFKRGIKQCADDVVSNGARGRASEKRILDDLGLEKNNRKVSTSEGNSIPDALTKRKSIEVKDCIGVSCTRQIRIQTEAARASGRESVLVTGSKTKVTKPAERAFDRIIRRNDLGPQ